MRVRIETLKMCLFGLSYVKDEISVADGTKTNLAKKSENLAREHEVTATSENGDSRLIMSSSRKSLSLMLNARTDLELTPEIPVSLDARGPDAQIIVPDDSSEPGSDYRAVDWQFAAVGSCQCSIATRGAQSWVTMGYQSGGYQSFSLRAAGQH